MPTQKAAYVVVREQLAPGSLHLPATAEKLLPVSAYPDQFELCTWLSPETRDTPGRRWSVPCWPTWRCLMIARAIASALAEAGAGLALAAALNPAVRPKAGNA